MRVLSESINHNLFLKIENYIKFNCTFSKGFAYLGNYKHDKSTCNESPSASNKPNKYFLSLSYNCFAQTKIPILNRPTDDGAGLVYPDVKMANCLLLELALL